MIGALAAVAVSMQPLAIPVGNMASPCSPRNERPIADAADAVSILAHMNEEMDVEHLCSLLRLPDLPSGLAWQGPVTGNQPPHFWGFYAPAMSEFGITHISLEWEIGGNRDSGGRARLFNALTIVFAPGKCPTEDRLASAMGIAPMIAIVPDPKASAPYRSVSFSIPQPRQDAVRVSYTGDTPCRIAVTHISDL